MESRYSNAFVSKLLKEVAAAYEVTGEDRFRIRAYQNAATAIEHATSEVKDLWEEGKLTEIPGIGSSIAGHLDEYFRTGKVRHFEASFNKLPGGMFGLFGIHGIGAKTAYRLAKELNIKRREDSLEVVKKAALEGKISQIEGFGERKEKEILEAIEKLKPNKEGRKRLLLPTASWVSEKISNYMRGIKEVLDIKPLGSLRRRVVTVGDIDFAVSTRSANKVIDHFVSFPDTSEILNKGDVKASILLKSGVRVDLMTEKPDAFGALLQHFTGSKAHNISLRKFALEKSYSLSEHCIKVKGKVKEFSDEESFYSFLGLAYIEPELREDSGEIEAAKVKKLPKLIELKDIRGDLHLHTNFSDGNNTLDEMVKKAREFKYEYIGISDHAPSINSRGEKEVLSLINKTKKHIESINNSNDSMRVLFGYEVNILTDVSVSLPDDYLKILDYAIGSIHTSFNQSKEKITERLTYAIKNPYIGFIAHPSGRLLEQRDSYEVDWEKVFKEVLERNKILEINAHPERLDLPDMLVREAVKKGVKLIINTDAHDLEDYSLMRYGIDVARRGWVESRSVVNTLPLLATSIPYLINE